MGAVAPSSSKSTPVRHTKRLCTHRVNTDSESRFTYQRAFQSVCEHDSNYIMIYLPFFDRFGWTVSVMAEVPSGGTR